MTTATRISYKTRKEWTQKIIFTVFGMNFDELGTDTRGNARGNVENRHNRVLRNWTS